MFRRIVQLYPRTTVLLIGILSVIFLLLNIEIISFFLNSRYKEKGSCANRFRVHDDILGSKPRPNQKGSSISKIDKRTIDKYGRRVTPARNLASRNNFILFFGCSFTFGEGLNDNETLPFYVSELAPSYMPYNYGSGGYGPQQMLAKLQSSEITKEINEKSGILIYTFIDHHFKRVIGSVSWGKHMPYYAINSDGKLIRKDSHTFTSGRPILSYLYSIINNTYIFKYPLPDLPFYPTEADIRLTCRIIEESYNIFRKKFNSDDFYVLFYPGSEYGPNKMVPYLRGKMIAYLRNAGIKYLDYSRLIDISNREFVLGDGIHPTAKAHSTIAAELVNDIPKLKASKSTLYKSTNPIMPFVYNPKED